MDIERLKEALLNLAKTKQERKELKKIIADVFEQSQPYRETMDQFLQVKAKKGQLEAEMMAGMPTEQEKLEKLDQEIKSASELVSDMALSLYMKGENVEIETDGAKYEPKIKVSFKRQLILF